MSQKTPGKAFSPDNRPIGVFDSGIGGLTVVRALRNALPNEDICYLGDTARVPYGNKSVDSIIRFAGEDAAFLAGKGVKALIVACNTASAVAMEPLRRRFPALPVMGVIEAGIEAVMRTGAERITVIGTRATVSSDAYRHGLHARKPSLLIESIPCPLFVPLAEEGQFEGKLAEEAFDLYLSPLRKSPPEVLLLGCTHYPLFREALERYFEGGVKIIDSAEACAESARAFLDENSIAASLAKTGNVRYYFTDLPSDFNGGLRRFLGSAPSYMEKAQLE